MSDTMQIEKLEKLFNEEKWTRATINNYSIKNFEDFNVLIDEFKEENILSRVKETTNEYLRHNKNSIVALYISSLIQLKERILEDNNIYNLIKIFSDNLKWNIVEYLCVTVLDYIEDKFVIKTLINTYINLNSKDKLPKLWERLIKVDYEEADTVVSLANLKEENKEIEEAINLYKKAINRYILIKNYVQVEELWKKLLTYDEIGYEYYFSLDNKISKVFSVQRSIELLKLLYEQYKIKEDYDTCLRILKEVINKSPSDEYCRREIIDVYRKKYAMHSHLEEYIKISNIEGSWRNIHDAINSFEKHIAFDKNNFVYHRAWGLGRITEVSKDVFTINFQNKQQHKMSLKMALSSLEILPKNHIWVLKMKNMDLLKQKVLEDIPWALKVLIQSYGNKASMKNFKEELIPELMTESKWNTWWAGARKVLKTDPKFGTLDNANNTFEVRDKPLSFEEKTYNSFKAVKDFTQRFNLVIDYLENTDPDPDYFEEMLTYFATYLNSTKNVNEQTILSYLLVKDVKSKYPFIKQELNNVFSDYFSGIDDPIEIYQKLLTSEFKKEYLLEIKKTQKDWIDIFVKIFYLYPSKLIYDELSTQDYSIIEKITKETLTRYKEYSEAFYWIVTSALSEKLMKKLNIDIDNIIFSMIHLIEIATKNIGLKKDMITNRRIVKQVKDYLLKDDMLFNHIENASEEFSKRLYAIIDEIISLEGDIIIKIKNKIADKFPDIDTDKVLKFDVTKNKTSIADKLLMTPTGYDKMRNEMMNIKDVEIPNNSKEIGIAMEKGDLRENAEYKAAKEQQTFLQNKLNKLLNDLGEAIIVRKEDTTSDFVTFGSLVKLDDKINNKTIEYTILGPWESQTDKNIISYQSPLGLNLLDKRVNDEIKFVLNEKQYHYIVKAIKIADF